MTDQEIRLRQLDFYDKSNLAKLLNNEKVWNNLRNHIPYPYDEKDAEFFINLTKEEKPKQNFGIEFKEQLCGVIGLIIQKDVYQKSAEIGYWLGEPFWGLGIATKAIELITNYGFDKLKLNRIYTGIFEYNLASMRVLEKNGFKKEGIFKNAIFKNDKIYDEHRFYKLNK